MTQLPGDLFALAGVEPPPSSADPAGVAEAAPSCAIPHLPPAVPTAAVSSTSTAPSDAEGDRTLLPHVLSEQPRVMESSVTEAAAPPSAPAPSASPTQAVVAVVPVIEPLLRTALLNALASCAAQRAAAAGAGVDETLRQHITIDTAVLMAQANTLLDHPILQAATHALALSTHIPSNLLPTLTARMPPPSSSAPQRASAPAQRTSAPASTPAHVPAAVREVVLVGARDHWYVVPDVVIATTQYATPTTVRVRMPDGTERSVRHADAVPLPDGDGQRRLLLLDAIARYGAALGALADRLHELGAYADRLAEASGARPDTDTSMRTQTRVPNPLTPTVIVAPVPPSSTSRAEPVFDTWQPPTVTRAAVTRHTPKMLILASPGGISSAPRAQRGHFCCPDDAAWIGCARLVNATVRAHRILADMLTALGTYPPSRQTTPLDVRSS